MELMSTSLDKFYKYVYCQLDTIIPEEILGKITLAVSHFFLHYIFQLEFTCPSIRDVTFYFVLNRPLKH